MKGVSPFELMRLVRVISHLAKTSFAQHRKSSSSTLIHPIQPTPSSISFTSSSQLYHRGFSLHPDFYDPSECRQLLNVALWKLDRSDRVRRRKKRITSSPSSSVSINTSGNDGLQDLFQGEYGFEEVSPLLLHRCLLSQVCGKAHVGQGHFDSVIHHYRESLLSSLPPPSPLYPDLIPLLNRAYAFLTSSPQVVEGSSSPPREALTHLLHLAPEGEILPHVDNLDASGGMIIGICLGTERILRLTRKGVDKGDREGWDILLPNGCLYLQRFVLNQDLFELS